MQTTAERLQDLYPFSDDILGAVDDIASQQNGLTYREFISANNVPDVQIFRPKHSKPVEILDIVPKEYNGVVVYHEAMGTSLDPNALMHIVPIALALPDKRIIAVGNPGRPGEGYGKIKTTKLPSVWFGNLRATVDPILEYLVQEEEEEAGHVGYSFGADKVQAAGQFSDKYDLKTQYGVSMDPASVKKRNLATITWAYIRTGKYLNDYVLATESTAYLESRVLSGGLVGYAIGLSRLSNIANAHALTKAGFENRVIAAHISQPEMVSSIMWGGESELAIDGLTLNIAERLEARFPSRVRFTRFAGQRHAMCDDLWFNTAMTLHGVEQALAA